MKANVDVEVTQGVAAHGSSRRVTEDGNETVMITVLHIHIRGGFECTHVVRDWVGQL